MQPPRPVQILRGAETQQITFPVLEPATLTVLPTDTADPVEPLEITKPAPVEANVPQLQARIGKLEADNQRLEGVLHQRESIHAKELQQVRQETTAEVRSEIAATLHQWTTVVDRLVVEHERLYTDAEQDVVTLSMAVARRIVGEAVQVDRDAVLAVVRNALDTVRDEKTIQIHMHPEDIETVKEYESEWLQRAGARDLRFLPDPQVDRGGCWIRTENGEVDARIQRQLESIQEALVVKTI